MLYIVENTHSLTAFQKQLTIIILDDTLILLHSETCHAHFIFMCDMHFVYDAFEHYIDKPLEYHNVPQHVVQRATFS